MHTRVCQPCGQRPRKFILQIISPIHCNGVSANIFRSRKFRILGYVLGDYKLQKSLRHSLACFMACTLSHTLTLHPLAWLCQHCHQSRLASEGEETLVKLQGTPRTCAIGEREEVGANLLAQTCRCWSIL